MPEFPHGKDARILMGPPGNLLDISQVCNTANLSRSADVAEVTAFSDTAKSYIPGMRDATISIEGMMDKAGTLQLDQLLAEASAFEYYPVGLTGVKYEGTGILTSLEIGADVGGAVTISGEIQISGEMTVTP